MRYVRMIHSKISVCIKNLKTFLTLLNLNIVKRWKGLRRVCLAIYDYSEFKDQNYHPKMNSLQTYNELKSLQKLTSRYSVCKR